MIKAIIFDCFGVLVVDALEAMIQEREESDPEIRQFFHDLMVRYCRGMISPEESTRIGAEYLGMTADAYRREIQIREGKNQVLLDYIVDLRKKYKTALLSNIGLGSLDKRFTNEERTKYFDTVVTSAELGIAKPDERIYQHTAELLGVETDECVFIDDRQEYLDGAGQTGMKTILYTNFTDFKATLSGLL